MTKEQTDQFVLEEAIYTNIWNKCNINCRRAPKTNINRELAKIQNNLSAEKMEELITRKLTYQEKMWLNTDFPLTDDDWNAKMEWLLAHGFKIQFVHELDIKFRMGL